MEVLIGNLGKQVEGEEVARWFELPLESVENALRKIGVQQGTDYEEYIILKHSGSIPISEFEDLYHLNKLVAENEELLQGIDSIEEKINYHKLDSAIDDLVDLVVRYDNEADVQYMDEKQINLMTKDRLEEVGYEGVVQMFQQVQLNGDKYLYVNGDGTLSNINSNKVRETLDKFSQKMTERILLKDERNEKGESLEI